MSETAPIDQPSDPFRNWSDPNLPGPEEVVARTLCIADGRNPDEPADDGAYPGFLWWQHYRSDARAVLTALAKAVDRG